MGVQDNLLNNAFLFSTLNTLFYFLQDIKMILNVFQTGIVRQRLQH